MRDLVQHFSGALTRMNVSPWLGDSLNERQVFSSTNNAPDCCERLSFWVQAPVDGDEGGLRVEITATPKFSGYFRCVGILTPGRAMAEDPEQFRYSSPVQAPAGQAYSRAHSYFQIRAWQQGQA
jgi:hypothetical protein